VRLKPLGHPSGAQDITHDESLRQADAPRLCGRSNGLPAITSGVHASVRRGYYRTMSEIARPFVRIARLAGWVLVAFALIAAAIEAGVLMAMEDWGALSALSLWDYMAPLGLREFRAMVRTGAGNAAWDSVLQPMLRMPAWLLLGAPGVLLVWATRGSRETGSEDARLQGIGDRPDPDAADIDLDPAELRAFVDSIPEDPGRQEQAEKPSVVVPLDQARRDER
jgi:hypothetical protein